MQNPKKILLIRKASEDDIPLIMEMAGNVFRQTYRDILTPGQMEYMMEWMYSAPSLMHQISDTGRYFYLAYLDGIPAGYVSFEEEGTASDGKPLWHLQKLYVLDGFRGEGLGAAMLDFVKQRLSELCPGDFRIELNVNRNNPAVGFYEHLGMKRVRQGDFPIGNGFYMNDYIYALEVNGPELHQ